MGGQWVYAHTHAERHFAVGLSTFIDPAIYQHKVVEMEGTGKKVGYLLYMGFNMKL